MPQPSAPDQAAAAAQTREIADCVFELIGNIIGQADRLAGLLSIPTPFIKALHTLDCPMAMKELGKRMHCDPSFVTLVADMLEKRGLARREPHPADRRVKNIVLTPKGEALKQRVEAEMTARMPWNRALTEAERAQLLALIRKMLSTDDGAAEADAASQTLHEQLAGLLTSALQGGPRKGARNGRPASSPEATGGDR